MWLVLPRYLEVHEVSICVLSEIFLTSCCALLYYVDSDEEVLLLGVIDVDIHRCGLACGPFRIWPRYSELDEEVRESYKMYLTVWLSVLLFLWDHGNILQPWCRPS